MIKIYPQVYGGSGKNSLYVERPVMTQNSFLQATPIPDRSDPVLESGIHVHTTHYLKGFAFKPNVMSYFLFH